MEYRQRSATIQAIAHGDSDSGTTAVGSCRETRNRLDSREQAKGKPQHRGLDLNAMVEARPAEYAGTVGRPARRRAARLAGACLLAYGIIVSLFVSLQRKLIYVPHRESISPAMTGRLAERLTDVEISTDDGLVLRGWLVAADPSATDDQTRQPLVLYFQGNAAHRGRRALQFGLLSQLGCRVLIVDYRGYGENPGQPSEAGLRADAQACWQYARESLDVPAERIVLFGESLGGGVATSLAADLCRQNVTPAGLVIRASFTSLVDAGVHHYPWLPVRWILRDRFDSVSHIPQVDCPILIMHGDRDRIIPFGQGEQLFAAAPDRSARGIPKQFVTLEGAGHNDIMHVAADQVEAALRTFLHAIEILPATND